MANVVTRFTVVVMVVQVVAASGADPQAVLDSVPLAVDATWPTMVRVADWPGSSTPTVQVMTRLEAVKGSQPGAAVGVTSAGSWSVMVTLAEEGPVLVTVMV